MRRVALLTAFPLMLLALASLGFHSSALVSPAMAAKAKEKPSEPAPVVTPATPKVDEKARTAAFATYEAEKGSGQKARAADALVALVDNPSLAPFHGEAYAKLGDLLVELKLPYAALCAYVRAFGAADDLNVADVGLRVPAAIELAGKVGDPMILQEPFGKNLALARTEDVRGQMALLAAQEGFRKESYGLALGILKIVKEGDPVYADARALEGVILNQQAKHESALIAFEAAQKAGRDKGVRFSDMVALNTARTFYAAENFPRAIQGYAAVSRGSVFWPEAQFERAWAHFRLDDFNGTLALLLPLNTPFFEDYYYPEADLLRIYSMFLLCKFPEANTSIDAFKTEYKPVLEGLRKARGLTPEEAFAAARTFAEEGKTGDIPKRILRPWATEDRFLGALAAIHSVEDEQKRLQNAAANPFTERSKAWLEDRKKALIHEEGQRVADRFAREEAELSRMLTDAEIFTLDILRMKTILYEQAAIAGQMPEVAETASRQEKVRKGYQEWPFEGEYWADELGYYRVNTPPECPASLRSEVKGGG